MRTSKKVTCRPCKEEDNWEIETPGGKVLPNHFATKADAMRAGKKYAMEAGAELEVEERNNSSVSNRSTRSRASRASKASKAEK